MGLMDILCSSSSRYEQLYIINDMNIQDGSTIFVISASITSAIIVMLGLWYHRERKKAGAKLRELREAMSEMRKD
jgi:hypothetical protein